MGFENQLGELIDSVWRKEEGNRRGAADHKGLYQRSYISTNDIYRLYNSERKTRVRVPDLRRFLETLSGIEKSNPAVLVLLQYIGCGSLTELLQVKSLEDAVLAEQAWLGFYQFWNMRADQKQVSQRVYINVPGGVNGAILLRRLVSSFADNKGLSMAKISGPGIKRADRIVIYTSGDAGSKAVISRLQKEPGRIFGSAVPAGTRMVSPGVALAGEPGNLALEFGGATVDPVRRIYKMPLAGTVSFGQFYSEVLHLALSYPEGPDRDRKSAHANMPKSRQEYKENVQLVLRLCGVHPDRPHEIARSDPRAVELVRRAHVALKRRGYTQQTAR